MALITCKDVTLAYENHIVLDGLSFQVNSGDYLCIIGENGSGKTTLMKALLGLKKVDRGTITYGDGLKKNEIGYLPQQTFVQRDFPASVYEVVLSGCLNRSGIRPFYTKEEKKLALENMAKLNITSLKKACYRELSGGQQQRVLLARALCATQKLLLLDEPVTGLDPVATGELYELIDHLNRKHGITVIMISHDITSAVARATHILHLHQNLTFFGKKEDYVECEICRRYGGHALSDSGEGGVSHECCDKCHS